MSQGAHSIPGCRCGRDLSLIQPVFHAACGATCSQRSPALLPGTVPAGEDDAHLLYHCLDVDQPVVAELAEEEAALVRALYND